MTTRNESHLGRDAAVLLLTGLLAVTAAFAQAPSTGNPKGSVAPTTQGSSANPPADPARTVDTGRSEPLDSSKGPAAARVNRTPRPDGGSATGGLTRRNPQDTLPSQSNSNAKPGK